MRATGRRPARTETPWGGAALTSCGGRGPRLVSLLFGDLSRALARKAALAPRRPHEAIGLTTAALDVSGEPLLSLGAALGGPLGNLALDRLEPRLAGLLHLRREGLGLGSRGGDDRLRLGGRRRGDPLGVGARGGDHRLRL